MDNEIVSLQQISKFFPGIKALDNVDMHIRTGEVHVLIGENGAGKSTLVKIMTGIYQPTYGAIYMDREQVHFSNSNDSRNYGITAIHQEATMMQELTVTENVFMGHMNRKARSGLVDWKSMNQKTAELLAKLDLKIDPETKIKKLSTAQRHMVEIVKALSMQARVVIMDEPTSALSLHEIEDLYKIIRQLKAEGKAIVFISHKFEEIMEIGDSYTVLRDGQLIGSGYLKDTNTEKIIQMMVGRSLDQMFPKKETQIGKPVLSVKSLSHKGVYKDINFTLHAGEILGFYGLIGAGRTEVMRTIWGIDQHTSGEIYIHNKKAHIKSPTDAMKHGIAYVPEDRQNQGTVLGLSIEKNITLPKIDCLCTFGIFTDAKQEKKIAQQYGNLMEVKASSWSEDVLNLSGGNQQKVVIAKWLSTDPRILILDEPTKGIDVATKAAVHEFVSDMAKKGYGIILISSEIPEVLGMADRIIVMHEGRQSGEFTRDEADSENLVLAAVGGKNE